METLKFGFKYWKKQLPMAVLAQLISFAAIIAIFSILLTFQITHYIIEHKYQEKMNFFTKSVSDFSKLAVVDELIRENYYGVIEEEVMQDSLISGYLSSLNDP